MWCGEPSKRQNRLHGARCLDRFSMGLMISKQTFGSGSRVVQGVRGDKSMSKEIGIKNNKFGKMVFEVVVVVVVVVVVGGLDFLLALITENHGKHISGEVVIYLTNAKPRSLSEFPMKTCDTFGSPPTSSRDHKDDITFFRLRDPELNLHLPLAYWVFQPKRYKLMEPERR